MVEQDLSSFDQYSLEDLFRPGFDICEMSVMQWMPSRAPKNVLTEPHMLDIWCSILGPLATSSCHLRWDSLYSGTNGRIDENTQGSWTAATTSLPHQVVHVSIPSIWNHSMNDCLCWGAGKFYSQVVSPPFGETIFNFYFNYWRIGVFAQCQAWVLHLRKFGTISERGSFIQR